jgi:hypothetical protein
MFNGSWVRNIIFGVRDKRSIHVPRAIWERTWGGLRRRGAGAKESAAVWAGRQCADLEQVEAVYFLDDYAGGEQCRGYHRVPVEALTEFFATLQQQRQVIIADIHTHPGNWVGLPAIVLPSFALPRPSLSISGVHIYKGNGGCPSGPHYHAARPGG